MFPKKPDYTSRGRKLDAKVPDKPAKRDNPLGAPVERRQRANSLRRLPTEHLMELAHTHDSVHVRQGAEREIGVRHDLVAESSAQFSGGGRPKMNALGPVGMREVTAMRFASSMAEEAQDEVNREYKNPRDMSQVGQIGVANVGGHLGVGFSGTQDGMAHTRAVEQRMLDLQKDYGDNGLAAHWSGRLEGVAVSDVFADKSDLNICAAKRASHVASSVANAANGSPLSPIQPVHRRDIAPPDSLIEMMSPATSGRGNLLSDFSAAQKRRGSAVAPDVALSPAISGRPRSKSVDSMANSCDICMGEHDHHMEKRFNHGK
ncbi:hypothetical protein [Burkholderia sp. 3C]